MNTSKELLYQNNVCVIGKYSTNEDYASYYKNKKHNLTDYDNKFMKWIDQIERIVHAEINLKLLDLPDNDYMMMFHDRYTPDEVAGIIINDVRKFINSSKKIMNY